MDTIARRGFVMTSLIAGFSLAATRGEAAAIHTDTAGLEAGEVAIPVRGGTAPGYYARPQGAGPFPIVLVVEEIFGVHEYIKDVCRRLAKLGYLAVATELYARQGDLSAATEQPQLIAIVSRAPTSQVMGDLDDTAAWAAANHGDAGRLAITGFCRGGYVTWLYSAHNPALKAAVAWYGPIGARTELQPQNVADVAPVIRCPVLGLYGGRDGGIPAADIQGVGAAARAAGRTAEIVVYPEAGHAFHADYRPSYVEGPATDGWQRMLGWFRQNGATPS